jgi:tetratricopeptide (TPR) repeat protein
LTSREAADFELMRAAQRLEADPAAVAACAGRILEEFPRRLDATLLLAGARRRLGDSAGALAALETLPRKELESAFLQLELGRAYSARDRGAEALAAFRRAVALDPKLADAWQELAAALFAVGETLAGDVAYAHFIRLSPDPPELRDAALALGENRIEAAEALLNARIQLAPKDVEAQRMLAQLKIRREEYGEAQQQLTACLDLAPGYAAARYDLAELLHTLQRHAEALPMVERLLATAPRHMEYLGLKARLLRLAGRNDEALAVMAQVVAEHPDEEGAWLIFGHLLRQVGQQARAIDMYRRALEVRPTSGRAYWSLANLKTFRFAGDDLRAMEELTRRRLRAADRTHLEFALGKALEDSGDFSASFERYARGNSLHRATMPFDPQAVTRAVERLKALYTAGFFAKRANWGSERSDPIFIVGMPRSGSTLLEQVLSSHSQVEGTRELTDLPAIALDLMSDPRLGGREKYPESIAELGPEEIEKLAERYLTRTGSHRVSDRPRFVDKMLGNFGHLGLIHLMFPRASIIDARRHPLGCGFSCYKQLFANGHAYSYDLDELGRYIREYVGWMDHFDEVVPRRVHRLYYERFVADPEGELRRLLEYCGLAFEPECLRFYANPRIVQTHSSEQVRQPIYSDSVDHWRRYERWLVPLRAALGDVLDRYPFPTPPPT